MLSKVDLDYLYQSEWYFEFRCEQEKEEDYKLKLNLFLLSIRIILQCDLSIKYILCKSVPHLSSKYSDDWKYAVAEKIPKRETEEFNKYHLEEVVIAYNCLKDFFNVSPRTAHAVNFLFLAYTSYYWMESYMLLMTALETLVSPDKIGTIVPEVTDRVVSLINDKNTCSKTKFSKIYSLRSDIIHGKILVNINFEKELPRLRQLQVITLKVFNILLHNDFKMIYKSENSKESFYNDLINK